MVIKNIVSSLPWKSSLGKRDIKNITGVIIHHTAMKTSQVDDVSRIRGDANYHITQGWGHLGYHYVIDKDGVVYQCVPEDEIGAHAGVWAINQTALAVCLDGDYSTESLNSSQVQALWGLLDRLCQRTDLPSLEKKGVKTHREVRPTPTSCPSDRVQKLVESYRMV